MCPEDANGTISSSLEGVDPALPLIRDPACSVPASTVLLFAIKDIGAPVADSPTFAMASSMIFLNALSAWGGFASWLVYFHRYECHMHGLSYLFTFLASCLAGYLALTRLYGFDKTDALSSTVVVASSYLVGLYGSLMIWRAFLNPLNALPGPWAARLSNFWWTVQLGNSDAYLRLQALHKKYGRVVRIGSNDLSIIDPEIHQSLSERHSPIAKGWWYDGDVPLQSMHTTRDRALHDARRKVWSPAFSDKAIRDYEVRISTLVDLLVSKIDEKVGNPINATVLFNLFTFDSMSLLAFGKDYGMLASGEKHHALKLLADGMQPLAYWFSTWFFRILIALPGAGATFQRFVQFCVDELAWRVANASESDSKGGGDIMSWILRAYRGVDHPEREKMLQADTRLIIVAGSDTTAASLTFVFYHLARNPAQVQKLRDELGPLTKGDWSNADIVSAKHLNACIWEALRMHPPVPSGTQRLTPSEGMQADGKHIPGNTIFWMPQYVIGRDPDNYEAPDDFVPERWHDKPEMVRNEDAWAPFSVGPTGCIGKNLALMELRVVIAKMVMGYDIRLADGEDGTTLLTDMKDHFAVELGDLDLVFTRIQPGR